MLSKRIKAAILAAVAIAVFWLLAQFVHPLLAATSDDNVIVTKIVDGDTVIIEGGSSVRLLGIDADERGHPCYQPALARLEELILNKQVRLESDSLDKDKYKRYLRWIWLDDTLINEQLVSEGLAVARQGDGGKYAGRIASAEQMAIDDKVGCKWK